MIFNTRLAYENWTTKYQYSGETPLQTFQRVARSLANVEKEKYGASDAITEYWYDQFLRMLVQFVEVDEVPEGAEDDIYISEVTGKMYLATGLKGTPGGRITANAGTEYGGATLLNCFINYGVKNAKIEHILSTPDGKYSIPVTIQGGDSRDDLINIMVSLLEQARTLSQEGGYGVNFDFIRPRGSLIKGTGVRHPGVVAYMEMWDKVAEMIVKGDQDGYYDTIKNYLDDESSAKEVEKAMPRKGAQMGVLSVWHPDIEEFVKAKQTKGRLTKFNVSVLVDDAFMEAVLNDTFYDLHFNGKVYKRVKARELYRLIMESTYTRAEPGILFYDNMNRLNPIPYLGTNNASNPCVAEGTLVATEKGLVPVEEISVGDMIQTTKGFAPVESIEVHKNYPVKKVTFSDGTVLRVTDGHIFHVLMDRDPSLGSPRYWNNTTPLSDLQVGAIIRKEPYLFGETENSNVKGTAIKSIEPDGFADVYDLYEPESDDWNTQGIVSRGCGEIPGNPFITTVCLLGSLNLTQYVKADRTFDWTLFEQDVAVMARFLENVNDIGNVPLPQYQWALENVRQYGMGINGLGSALYMMGIRYGSPESLEFVEKMGFVKEDTTWRISALLAEERGPASAFDPRFFDSEFFKNHCKASDETKALMRKHGLRNLKTTTNPPLGNSSVICDMVSNGIEPVFSTGYDRTVIVDKWPKGLTQENVKAILTEIQVGDAIAWQGEYEGRTWYYEPHNRGLCFIDKVEDYGYAWVKERFPEDVEGNADYLCTAQDLTVDVHVDVQVAIQKYLNQSTSKTANVPYDYPFEDFQNLYIDAWKKGLIGFTTYRAGTMEAVLSVSSEDANARKTLLDSLKSVGATPNDADVTEEGVVIKDVKLPESFVNGPTKVVRREGAKYYLHLSYLENDAQNPVALWIHCNHYSSGEYVTLNRAFRAVVKLLNEKGVDSDLVDRQVNKIQGNGYHEKLGKIISMALRHNISLPSIVKALSNIEGDYISTTLTAVRKFLMEAIQDGTKFEGAVCTLCGSKELVFESGCDRCLDCGASNCA